MKFKKQNKILNFNLINKYLNDFFNVDITIWCLKNIYQFDNYLLIIYSCHKDELALYKLDAPIQYTINKVQYVNFVNIKNNYAV